jgi:uncharacterized protein
MDIAPTQRTRVRRAPQRARHDRSTIEAILDEGIVCHVGVVDAGEPRVIPMLYARDGDVLYLHGATSSRLVRAMDGGSVCATVTLLDGLVLARSAFHHSMNYRSVVVMGKAREVTDREEKLRVLTALVEHVVRGRSAEARGPNEAELRGTLVLALPIGEASAKIRTGPPLDDEEDYSLPVWAGVLPMKLAPQEPITDERSTADIPDYVRQYRRR